MLNVLPDAIALLMTLEGLAALILGTVLGIILGAMPGIGSTVAVAIILPFTLSMGQSSAIILLLAVYAGSVYGGSISAILINTPGTPQSAATCLDGFPMSQRGEAGQALGWATVASVVGGLVSAVVLILAAPQLARFALEFGPIETFALILLGLTCIVSVSTGSLLKGLLSGMIGIFLSLVGGDPITGEFRSHLTMAVVFRLQPSCGGDRGICAFGSVDARQQGAELCVGACQLSRCRLAEVICMEGAPSKP